MHGSEFRHILLARVSHSHDLAKCVLRIHGAALEIKVPGDPVLDGGEPVGLREVGGGRLHQKSLASCLS